MFRSNSIIYFVYQPPNKPTACIPLKKRTVNKKNDYLNFIANIYICIYDYYSINI